MSENCVGLNVGFRESGEIIRFNTICLFRFNNPSRSAIGAFERPQKRGIIEFLLLKPIFGADMSGRVRISPPRTKVSTATLRRHNFRSLVTKSWLSPIWRPEGFRKAGMPGGLIG